MWSCTFVVHCDVLEVLKSEIYANKWFDKICDELVVASVTNLHCLRWRFCNALCDEEKVTRGIIMNSNTFPNIIKKETRGPIKMWHVAEQCGATSASMVVPCQHPRWRQVTCQRVTTSSAAGVAMPRGIAFNDGSGHQLWRKYFVTEDRLFDGKGRFVIEKFTSMTNLSISSRWDKCDGICMTNEFLSLIRHKTSSMTFRWPTVTKMNCHICEIPY